VSFAFAVAIILVSLVTTYDQENTINESNELEIIIITKNTQG